MDAPASHPASRRYFREWLFVLVLAMGVALFIRAVCFQAFRIPTPSMEKNLLVGDFVLVSKLHYGPRLPLSIGIPLTNRFVEQLRLPLVRFPGFTQVRRGDVMVFNYPFEDAPIDRKTHYIKRVIAIPGDTLSIHDKELFVNAEHIPLLEGMQQKWIADSHPEGRLPIERLSEEGAEQITFLGKGDRRIAFESTRAVADTVASWSEVDTVQPFVIRDDGTYNLGGLTGQNGFGRDRFGPVYVPAQGDTLVLDAFNWPIYSVMIRRHEGQQARALPGGLFEINGRTTRRYVVQQDYYFVMGDNRDSSSDSRTWGFVPSDHVVGKAVLIYFSWDEMQGRARLGRLFSKVH